MEPKVDFMRHAISVEDLIDSDYTVHMPAIKPKEGRTGLEGSYDYGLSLVCNPAFFGCPEALSPDQYFRNDQNAGDLRERASCTKHGLKYSTPIQQTGFQPH
jgi:hypothetical protein